MNKKFTRTLVLTATALVGAFAAHGEMRVAKANVTFGFQAGGVKFPAGVYEISDFRGTGIFSVKNASTGSSKFVNTISPVETQDRNARLQFVCMEERGCALSKMILSDGRQWTFRTPRMKASEMTRTAAVYLDQKQAD